MYLYPQQINWWDHQPIFFVTDFLLVPLYIYTIHRFFTNYIKNKPSHYKEYFMRGWYVRLTGCLLTALMYDYYYNGGDTIVYYHYALGLNKLFFSDPGMIVNLFLDPKGFEARRYLFETTIFVDRGAFFIDETTSIIVFIAGFLNVIFLRSYLLTSITLTLFSFYGCWKIFSMFHEMYPQLKRQLAISCLFIPSVFFWGTGIMKEPLCIGGLGLLSYNVYELFFKRGNKVKNIFLALVGSYIIFKIKVYIVLSFLPALAVWVFSRYRYNIKSPFLKTISTPLFIIIAAGAGALVLQTMASYAERYALDEMMRTAKDTQNWLVTSSKDLEVHFILLGDIEYSILV
jgi:hypothetical protein